MITKEHIISEIQRTANENGGRPLGIDRFEKITGIRFYDWFGKFWPSWSMAITEAGFSPNRMTSAYDENYLLTCIATLIKKLGHFPSRGEFLMRAREDKTFPDHNTFSRRYQKNELIRRLKEFCSQREGYDGVLQILESTSVRKTKQSDGEAGSTPPERVEFGFVYLMKSGKYYKVGRTNSVGRRERELSIQLPERAEEIYKIKTDDPVGIEKYWHQRFESKRKNGEWFDLSRSEVAAFKRRKSFM